MIADGFTYVLLLIFLNGDIVTMQSPQGTTELQCKNTAVIAPKELKDMVKYAACVRQYPKT